MVVVSREISQIGIFARGPDEVSTPVRLEDDGQSTRTEGKQQTTRPLDRITKRVRGREMEKGERT